METVCILSAPQLLTRNYHHQQMEMKVAKRNKCWLWVMKATAYLTQFCNTAIRLLQLKVPKKIVAVCV